MSKHLGWQEPLIVVERQRVMVMLILLLRYVLSWSGGKDSTASIILAHLNKEPLNTIIFSEVMYDNKRNISGEHPKHIDFVRNVAKPLFESWGYEVLILRSEKDYLSNFNSRINNPRKHIENKGKRRGFVISGLCSIKRDCKIKPIQRYYAKLDDEYTEYVGICADEPQRLKSLHKASNKVSLLEKYGYTEEMAKNLCNEFGLLSPTYNLSSRGGCWFCPNAKIEEHKEIRRLYPELWKEFVSLEDEKDIALNKWNVFRTSLRERELIISKEE